MYLFRLIQSLRNSGRFGQFGAKSSQTSSSLSIEEAYKILGLEKGCSKQDVLDAATKLQKRIHPDMVRNVRSDRLSQYVSEAKEKILKTDFS